MPGERTERSAGIASSAWLPALGGAFIALAGHLELLRRFGTVLPFRDPWKATAVDLLGPWTEGRLQIGDFFQPLNDHWPVLTRALSFLLVRLNGQWNNLVETSVNAVLLTGAIALFLRLVLPSQSLWARVPFAILTGLIFALPITWENTLWGIQSLVYLHVGLTLAYLAAVSFARSFSKGWWLGHLAGVLVLFTVHSGVLAQAAAVFILGLRYVRSDSDRRVTLAGLGFALLTLALFALFFPSLHSTAALRADSWELALDVFLRQLAWPLPHPGWAFLVYLPWLVFAYNRVFIRRASSADVFLLALGLWVGAQAAAIGYGRGAETYTFASRYCDYLALGWLVNAACLVRLSAQFTQRRARAALALFSAAWFIAPLPSFRAESVESHAGYNLSRRPGENERNLNRVRQYFATHDTRVFDGDGRREFYTYPPEILPLLDRPKFAALLPPESGAPGARTDHGRMGSLADGLIAHPGLFLSVGGLLLTFSFVGRKNLADDSGPSPLEKSSALVRGTAKFIVPVALLASLVALAAWEYPTTFSHDARFQATFRPNYPGSVSEPLSFERFDGARSSPVDARGGVVTEPISWRKYWFGTHLVGEPEFRGTLRSRPFRLHAHYLILPFTGFPCSPGNGLRLRLVNPADGREQWISYEAPNPGVGFDLWTIDVSEFNGQEASVVLFDGRDGVDGGWTGASSPIQTDTPSVAKEWRASFHRLRSNTAHDTVAGLACVLVALCAAQVNYQRSTRAGN